MLPKEISKLVPKTHLMSETEWRSIGVQQSQGWIHYMIHQPGMCLGGGSIGLKYLACPQQAHGGIANTRMVKVVMLKYKLNWLTEKV